MAYGLASEDVLACLVILADGRLDARLGEVVDRAELLQRACDDHFGEAPDDLRNALLWLAMESELVPARLGDDHLTLLGDLTVRQLAPPMLERHDVWFNDEGEHWLLRSQSERSAGPALRWMIDLLSEPSLDGPCVLSRLAGAGWGADFPRRCMRGGDVARMDPRPSGALP